MAAEVLFFKQEYWLFFINCKQTCGQHVTQLQNLQYNYL